MTQFSNVSLLDNPLWGNNFVDDEMRQVMSARSYVRACVNVEVALAQVQADLKIIPAAAADQITECAAEFQFDMDKLSADTAVVGYPILPIVEQLAKGIGEAGRWLHWGATTQDIMDTASVLQLRDALQIIETRVFAVRNALAILAREYRNVPMAGRTHLQQALPTTFGWKAAVWMSAFDRHLERLLQIRSRLLVVEFAGASGTLASLGGNGLSVQEKLADKLELGVPSITWHSIRDTIAEAVGLMAMIGGSLGKIATDISIMTATELGEVSEPFETHRGASSTMPQKQNPVSCELIIAAARLLRNHASTALDAMVHDFERATGPWHLEWSAVPEAFCLASGALRQAHFMLSGLRVNEEAMSRNLDHSRGLIVAEAVMMALAPSIGRIAAHDLVYSACRRAAAQNASLYDVLTQDTEICARFDTEKIRELTTPSNYIGLATKMVDRILHDTSKA